MKKVLAVCFSFLLLFGVVACGNDSQSVENKTPEETSTAQADEKKAYNSVWANINYQVEHEYNSNKINGKDIRKASNTTNCEVQFDGSNWTATGEAEIQTSDFDKIIVKYSAEGTYNSSSNKSTVSNITYDTSVDK